MPKLIMNEKAYIEKTLESHEKDIDISMSQLIYLLVKYFYIKEELYNEDDEEVDNYKKNIETLYVDVDLELQKFNFDNYYSFKYKKQIIDACRVVLRYDLRLKECDSIPLLSDELEKIKMCENDRERKLLFTFYIYARFKDKNGKIDEDVIKKDIFKMANINSTKLEMNRIIKSLREKGFISQNFINDNINIWVKFGSGEEVMSIESLDNLGNQIIAYLNKDKKMCECCGKIIKIKSKNGRPVQYCKECATLIDREKAKERMKQLRA